MSVVFSLRLKTPRASPSPGGNGLFFAGDNGSAVMLIHGLTGTPNEMRFLATAMSKKGFTAIVPRLANHGRPLEILKNTKWEEFYQSAREAFLKAGREHGKIFVGGLSMGALLALLLAEEFPQKVAGVSCLSPTLFYDGWNTPRYKWLLPLAYKTPLKHFFYFKEEPPYGLKNEAIRRLVHSYYSQARLDDLRDVDQFGYPFFPLTQLQQLEELVAYVTPRLDRVTTPVQLIQAKDDDMTSVRNSQFIYDRIKSEKKELVLMLNSYHLVNADQERSHVAQKMEEFFRTI